MWIGVSHQVGGLICYWILIVKGDFPLQTDMNHINKLDTTTKDNNNNVSAFNATLYECLCNESFILDPDEENASFILYIEDINDESAELD